MAALIKCFFYSLAPRIVYLSLIFFARKSSRGQNCRSWSWDVVQLEVAASVISIKCLRHSLTHLWLVSNATDAKVLGPLSNLYLRKSGILTVRLVRLNDDDEEFDISSFACSINWWQRRGSGGVKAIVLCINNFIIIIITITMFQCKLPQLVDQASRLPQS